MEHLQALFLLKRCWCRQGAYSGSSTLYNLVLLVCWLFLECRDQRSCPFRRFASYSGTQAPPIASVIGIFEIFDHADNEITYAISFFAYQHRRPSGGI